MIIAAAALTLAACGQRHQANGAGSGASVVVPGANGASVTMGTSLPTNLPDWVKVYPGATVTTTTTAPGGGLIGMQTSAAPDAVAAFYKQAATASGFTTAMDSSSAAASGANHVLVFTKDGTPKESLDATITTENGSTKIAILYGQG
jgi:hypothetical protein